MESGEGDIPWKYSRSLQTLSRSLLPARYAAVVRNGAVEMAKGGGGGGRQPDGQIHRDSEGYSPNGIDLVCILLRQDAILTARRTTMKFQREPLSLLVNDPARKNRGPGVRFSDQGDMARNGFVKRK